MVLFPQLDTAYYDGDDRSVHQMLEYYYASAIQINQSFWSEADIDSRFHAGDQTLWNDIYGNLPAFRRRQWNFNRIRRIVNMPAGYQRQHRLSTIVVPHDNADEETADQFSNIIISINNKGNVYETISDAFHGALITGMNLLSVWMDYREDPINGDIKVDNVSYNEYLIDPFFKKHDLSDCRFLWTRKWLSKNEIKSLYPQKEEEIESMYARGWRDGKFQFQPEAYNYAIQDLLSYDEFYYLDYRKKTLLVDTRTGETMEWRYEDEGLKRFMSEYRQIQKIEQTVPTVKLAVMANGKVLYHGLNPMGIDKYPFVPVLAYYEPQIPYFPWRVQGIVRGLRDAQYLYNRRRVIELDILESQVNSGIKYKENALVNPKDAFLSGQGRVFAIAAEASIDDVQAIPPPQIPGSMFQLSEMMANEIQQISGVNEELLGSASDDKAGILSMLRQGAGLVTLQPLFDKLNFSQKLLGEICIDLIQNNYSAAKVRAIIKEEPTDQFYNRAFQKYGCVVEEGLNTSTQRQMQFAQLLQLRELGIPVPASILIESSTLQNKKKLVEAIQKEEESAAQAQQKQDEVATQLYQAQMDSLHSRAVADKGLGMERAARVEENRALAVERIAEAQNQRAMSVYHELQAVKELEELDLSNLQSLLGIIQNIQSQKKVAEGAEMQEIQSQPQNID